MRVRGMRRRERMGGMHKSRDCKMEETNGHDEGREGQICKRRRRRRRRLLRHHARHDLMLRTPSAHRGQTDRCRTSFRSADYAQESKTQPMNKPPAHHTQEEKRCSRNRCRARPAAIRRRRTRRPLRRRGPAAAAAASSLRRLQHDLPLRPRRRRPRVHPFVFPRAVRRRRACRHRRQAHIRRAVAREPATDRPRVRREHRRELRAVRIRPRVGLALVRRVRRRLLAEGYRAQTRTGTGSRGRTAVRRRRDALAHAADPGTLRVGVLVGPRAERTLVARRRRAGRHRGSTGEVWLRRRRGRHPAAAAWYSGSDEATRIRRAIRRKTDERIRNTLVVVLVKGTRRGEVRRVRR